MSSRSQSSTNLSSVISHLSSNLPIAVLASRHQQAELNESPLAAQYQLIFAPNLEELTRIRADAYMDLLFEDELLKSNLPSVNCHLPSTLSSVNCHLSSTPSSVISHLSSITDRINSLNTLLPAPVFVNSVIYPLQAGWRELIRINAWPGFLRSGLLEVAAWNDEGLADRADGNNNSTGEPEPVAGTKNAIAQKANDLFKTQLAWVKNIPGLVAPRIIAMIIYEARQTLAAGVSSKEEIDTAMKLGTGYPLGPFEWTNVIGTERVDRLLELMTDDG